MAGARRSVAGRAPVSHTRVAAGETQLAWDGRDDRGDALASGMYFVRMEVEGDAFTRRIVLAR